MVFQCGSCGDNFQDGAPRLFLLHLHLSQRGTCQCSFLLQPERFRLCLRHHLRGGCKHLAIRISFGSSVIKRVCACASSFCEEAVRTTNSAQRSSLCRRWLCADSVSNLI